MKILPLLLALIAFAAQAQNEDSPPLVSAELACLEDRDCGDGAWCTGSRDKKKHTPGVCRTGPKPPKKQPDGVERYQYAGIEPDGFHLVSEVRGGFVAGGIGAFAGGYLLTLVISLSESRLEGAVPLLGPFLWADKAWTSGWLSGVLNFFIALTAGVEVALQVAGLVLLAVAGGAPRRWLERDVGTVAQPGVTLVPGAAGAPMGASLVGRF